MPARRRVTPPTPIVIPDTPPPRLYSNPGFSHEQPTFHPEFQLPQPPRMSDTALILAVLFGISIGNISVRPVLIITLWLSYALWSFYGDLTETLERRQARLEEQLGPSIAHIIVGIFRALVLLFGLFIAVGFFRVVKMFW